MRVVRRSIVVAIGLAFVSPALWGPALWVPAVSGMAVAGSPAAPVSGPASRFAPVGPLRLTDTREADCNCTRLDPSTIRVQIAGLDQIPPSITAAAITVTATNTGVDGFVTAYPSGGSRPGTSTLNARAGADTSNSTVVPVGATGAIEVYAQTATDLVVDVTGVFLPGATATSGRFVSTAPARLIDTRELQATPLARSTAVDVPLPAGVAGDATALAVNVTTLDEVGAGFVSGYAAGADPAATSFMNPDGTGAPRAASVIVPASAQGITVFTSAGGHVVVDLVGWFTGASAPPADEGLFVPVEPSRLLDARESAPRLWAGATREIAQPFAGAAAVVTNVTLARPDDAGFVTAYAAGTPRAGTSSINAAVRDGIVANFAISSVSDRGVGYFSSAGTDLVVDVMGYYTGTPASATLPIPPRVFPNPRALLIGDSTFAALNVVPASQLALRGFQPLLDLEPCRRLASPSCQSAFTLRTPPTAVQAIAAAPPLTDIVVIRAGYNDGSTVFESSVRAVVLAARARGVRTVLWLTYSEGTGNQLVTYPRHNATLRAMANSGAYPELVVADWRTYASGASGWYADDRVHLMRNGAWATADYISRWVAHLVGNPCPVPWTPGGPTSDPCPSPDVTLATTGSLPDVRGLYGL